MYIKKIHNVIIENKKTNAKMSFSNPSDINLVDNFSTLLSDGTQILINGIFENTEEQHFEFEGTIVIEKNLCSNIMTFHAQEDIL